MKWLLMYERRSMLLNTAPGYPHS